MLFCTAVAHQRPNNQTTIQQCILLSLLYPMSFFLLLHLIFKTRLTPPILSASSPPAVFKRFAGALWPACAQMSATTAFAALPALTGHCTGCATIAWQTSPVARCYPRTMISTALIPKVTMPKVTTGKAMTATYLIATARISYTTGYGDSDPIKRR